MQLHLLAKKMLDRGQTLATVESCTGGGIATACTDLAGSSQWFLGSVVTYANEMKIKLGVEPSAIEHHGAVSIEVAEQMAQCGLEYSAADWSVAVTGIAGPGGGSAEKPVGTVCFAWAHSNQLFSERMQFSGDRLEIRKQTVEYAIDKLVELLK
ncbi:CinA family protein [Reinekea thalattae]|uniref:CinA family protein n=1 Tax=Reinekea thalattae TaxID=2593301 RepID=A0A5C8Z9J4_9GAMM|nr:CinA family protein [Reinekea thalattae]TXR54054.1 CinA family protein [Reinekea thalattae]